MLVAASVLSLLPTLLASGLAGNENYAVEARRSLSSGTAHRRATSAPSFEPESVTFAVGSGNSTKHYLSPTGSQFKSYTLQQEWGLDEYAGEMFLITVFQVEGQVTCDTLGDLVLAYENADDVWDQVSCVLCCQTPMRSNP
jgi:hypothetical protein